MAAGIFQNFCNWMEVGTFLKINKGVTSCQLAALGSQPVFSHILCEHLGSLEQQLEPLIRGRQCLFRMPRLLSPVIADLCLRPLPEGLSCRNPCPKKRESITYSTNLPDILHAVTICCRYSYWTVFK